MTDFIANDDDGRWDADRAALFAETEQRSWENHGDRWPEANDDADPVGLASPTNDDGHSKLAAVGPEYASEMIGERRLAALHGGEMQQSDINPASLARIEPMIERLPGVTEDRTREQLVAEYGVSEGLRLSDQRADQVAIVDDALRRPIALEVAPRHGQHRRGPEIADQAIIVDVHLHAAADQARGHGVEIVPDRVTMTVALEKSVVRCDGSGSSAASSIATSSRRRAF
jgi:hypothetical protein